MKRTLNLLAVVICVAAILCSCENGKTENNRNAQPGGKQVRTYFSTIDDFNKFITTGSEKPEDYSAPPVPDIPTTMLSTVRQFYITPESIIDFDTELFGKLKSVSFKPTESGMNYLFEFNTFVFSITAATDDISKSVKDTVKDYMDFYNGVDYPDWKTAKEYSEGYVKRVSNSKCQVYYEKGNNILESVNVVVGNSMVKIWINDNPAGMTTAEAAEEFLTSPATAGFAALFSEDDTVFRAAVDKINAGLAGK